MWPFARSKHEGAKARLPVRPREPRLADGAAFASCFARWSEAAHREVVHVHQVGYLRPGDRGRTVGWRPWPPLPMLQIVVEPGESIDFADPVTGFAGFGRPPPSERVLTLWADDLLSVSHGEEWMYVIDAERPFQREWLDMLVPPLCATYEFWHAVVSASFVGPTPPGLFRMAELDATTYLTRVHIEDRRHDADTRGPRPVRAPTSSDRGRRPPG